MLNSAVGLRLFPSSHIAGRVVGIVSWFLLFAMVSGMTSMAQTGSRNNGTGSSAYLSCQPMTVARVRAPVDEDSYTTLRGNVHRLAQAQYDQGRVEDGLLMEHIIMTLQRTRDQEQALNTRIDQMHNTRSPYYHQWLRAADVGGCYGVAESDIAAVTGWLEKHGFQIDAVPAGKMFVMFTGTAGQVREAFRTEIHNLNVRGEKHIANMSEPQIPTALAPVVAGFRSLHNFFPKPLSHVLGPVQRDSKTGKWHVLAANVANGGAAEEKPQPNRKRPSPLLTFGLSGETFWAVGPQDFYTIYNETPLLTSSSPINGSGQTLAIVQDSDVDPADVTSFRSQFGLPAYPTTPNATQGGVNYMFGISAGNYCSDPGILSGPESEADIDVQWIGATAPAATIDFVACADTATTFGGDLAAPYIVNSLDSTVSAFSLSFGWCEANLTVVGLQPAPFYVTLWEQAVAEGQTPVVSSGDTGDNMCDRGNGLGPNGQDISVSGLSVNGLASTPYNISAGGTDFSDSYQTNFTPTAYWNTNDTSPYLSALSYIPEMAWNDTCTSTVLVDYIRYAYSITYPNGPEGLCNDVTNFSEEFTTLDGGSGGISTISSLPTWQSVYGVGLATNYTSTSYRNLPDVSLFASDGFWSHFLVFCESDLAPCDYSNGSDAVAMAAGGTSFVAPMLGGIIGLLNQAWPSGNPAQPTRQGQANYTFYALATAEYGTPGSENTSSTAPSVYTCEGSNINAITAYSGIFPSCTFYNINRTNQVGSSTCLAGNTAGCLVSGNDQPCASGSPSCFTNTSGDAYGLLSNSPTTFEPAFFQSEGYSDATGLGSVNIANLVTNWTSVTPQFASTTTASANPTELTSSTATTTLTATVTATGRGGIAPPLGTVSFYTGGACTGTALGVANLIPATACTTNCNSAATLSNVTGAQIGSGAQSVVACFSGDGANDAPSTSPAVTVTSLFSTTTTETVTATPSSSESNVASSVTFSATVGHSSGSAVPTGTVTFTNGSTTLGGGTLNGSGTATYSTSSLSVGSYSVVASYGGDSNYASSISSATTLKVVDFTVAASPTTITVTAGNKGTTTLTITPLGGFDETLNYTCAGLPSLASCTFTSAGANSETLSIATTAASSARSILSGHGGNVFYALLLPGLLGLVLPAISRKQTLRKLLTMLAALALSALWMPACSSNGGSATHGTGTPAGTYTVTVTAATAGTTGALSHTAPITLTVQ